MSHARTRYTLFAADRQEFVDRGHNCAALTIPSLFSEESLNSSLGTPFSGKGAQLVSNLSSKFALALFPMGESFTRLVMPRSLRKELEAEAGGGEDLLAEFDTVFAATEKEIMLEVERTSLRVDVNELLDHLLVVGNVMLYAPADKRQRNFHLEQFVVARDEEDIVKEIIIKETFSTISLSDEFLRVAEATKDGTELAKTHDVYTWVVRQDDGSWKWHQELNDQRVGTGGVYTADEMPYIVLRGIKRSGETYGRSMVERYLADFNAINGYHAGLQEIASLASMVKFGVRRGSGIIPKNMTETVNGGFFQGDEGDIWALQIDKLNDMRIIAEGLNRMEDRLDMAFFSPDMIRRNGERVTATEISTMTVEFSQVQAAMYATLAEDLQMPLAKLLMHRLKAKDMIPDFPKQVEPTIITGTQALGRGTDMMRLQTFQMSLESDERLQEYVKPHEMVKRLANGAGVDSEGLIKTNEEVAAERDQERVAQAQSDMVGPLTTAAAQNQQQQQSPPAAEAAV